VPLEWAKIQLNLGTALMRLGEREGGTARLEEAVAACRAGLEEMTRDRAPLQWAIMQMSLGNALARLGEREGGTVRLEGAVGAVGADRAALEDATHEPARKAVTASNRRWVRTSIVMTTYSAIAGSCYRNLRLAPLLPPTRMQGPLEVR
jgi:hypothetical protein